MKDYRTKTGYPWAIVDGIEIVYEQATLQFEHLTGYRAPRNAMKQAIRV